MVSSLAYVGLLGYVCGGESSRWILSQVFSRDFQLLFAVYLLSSPYGNLCIHIKGFFIKGLFNPQLFRAICLLLQLLKGQLQQQFISLLPLMPWSCEHFISESPTELQAQGFLLVFLVLCGIRWIISSCVFCYSTYMYILFSGSLKSIYGGSLIDLVSTCYLQWKCYFFYAEVVFNISFWDELIFLQLFCVSVFRNFLLSLKLNAK